MGKVETYECKIQAQFNKLRGRQRQVRYRPSWFENDLQVAQIDASDNPLTRIHYCHTWYFLEVRRKKRGRRREM